jgi:anti-sigma factor RsiW
MSPPNDNQTIDVPEDPDDLQLTEIVAYLDGELDESECLRLEKMLASSPPLRGYAESLDRTWQLLDSLGQADVSDEFTHKTLASLTTISSHDDHPADKNAGRRLQWITRLPVAKTIVWTLAGFAGSAAGLQLAQKSQNQQANTEDVQLLRQLDLLENYPKIYPVPNVEFLRSISELKDRPASDDNSASGVSAP